MERRVRFIVQWYPAPMHPPISHCPSKRHLLEFSREIYVVLSILALRYFDSKASLGPLGPLGPS